MKINSSIALVRSSLNGVVVLFVVQKWSKISNLGHLTVPTFAVSCCCAHGTHVITLTKSMPVVVKEEEENEKNEEEKRKRRKRRRRERKKCEVR